MQQVIISKFTEASPCFGCTKRTPFCHRIGQCELFTDWRARKDAFTRAEQAKRRGYQTARDQRSEQVYKQLKKRSSTREVKRLEIIKRQRGRNIPFYFTITPDEYIEMKKGRL